jgi:hypothetical protein
MNDDASKNLVQTTLSSPVDNGFRRWHKYNKLFSNRTMKKLEQLFDVWGDAGEEQMAIIIKGATRTARKMQSLL